MSEAIKKPASPEGIIQMQGVNKWYGQFHVLKDINLNVSRASVSSSAARRVPASPPPFVASIVWKNTSRVASWSMAWN